MHEYCMKWVWDLNKNLYPTLKYMNYNWLRKCSRISEKGYERNLLLKIRDQVMYLCYSWDCQYIIGPKVLLFCVGNFHWRMPTSWCTRKWQKLYVLTDAKYIRWRTRVGPVHERGLLMATYGYNWSLTFWKSKTVLKNKNVVRVPQYGTTKGYSP